MHFGDNEVANSVAIKGTSRAKDLSRAVVDLRLCWFHLRLAPWIASPADSAAGKRGDAGSPIAMGRGCMGFSHKESCVTPVAFALENRTSAPEYEGGGTYSTTSFAACSLCQHTQGSSVLAFGTSQWRITTVV